MQEQLTDLMGMEVNNISYLKQGKHMPKKENLEKLCQALNVQPKELFDFGCTKTRAEIISDLNKTINSLFLKDLQYFKKVINSYLETK